MPSAPSSPIIQSLDPGAIAGRLEQVRERTLSLVAGLDWEVLQTQHIPILSPMVWDLGHIGHFEELWLSQNLAALPPLEAEFAGMFDAVLNPRPTRKDLPLPVARALWGYLSRVRTRSLEIMRDLDLGRAEPILAGGFVYEMVAEHEEQHQETILQLLQVLDSPTYMPAQRRRLPPGRQLPAESMILIPGGPFRMGCQGPGFAYDNEREPHDVTLPPYLIDRVPVSSGDFLGFVEEGGYVQQEFWSVSGWNWCEASQVRAPGNWFWRDDRWWMRHMDRVEPLRRDLPVTHVCFHEAEAYARWAGKRLPTEPEWEKAALWDPTAKCVRLYPWGDSPADQGKANVDQLAFQPAPLGAYPDGASAYGVEHLIGDVWEWTSSEFQPYPGFQAFPYAEYSEIFFGSEYKVLRGGSWASRPAVVRGTIRNWDYPIRRQIFAGFRCVRDSR